MPTRDVVFEVMAGEEGRRLDAYLAAKLRGMSRTEIQGLIRFRLARVGSGARLKPASLVKAGLKFAVTVEDLPEEPPPPLPVVFEDEHLLVVNKPAGLPVHPAGRHFRCTLTAALAQRPGPRADPAHRLDRETSGLLACGKGRAATAALKHAFAAGEVHKVYLAVVEGWPERVGLAARFRVDRPLALGEGLVRVRMQVGQGKPAVTEFQTRERFQDRAGQTFTLLACEPRTGRQHQIRAHLGSVGLPVVGDKIYGTDETTFIRYAEDRLTPQDQLRMRLPRQALHAAELAFRHPILGRPLHFSASLPQDLGGFLDQLRQLHLNWPAPPESEAKMSG